MQLIQTKNLFLPEVAIGVDLERLENEDSKLAERYGKSMINDFNNGTIAGIDWSVLLDQTGGSNHIGNLCFAFSAWKYDYR